MGTRKGLVIIPTYNEKENIAALIPQVLGSDPSLDILVVDDNSPDGTAEIVADMAKSDGRITLLEREAKLGLGTAYVAGFRYALDAGYELIFEMDADFSHSPGYLPDLIRKAESADVVIGSRYLTGVNVVNWPMHRLLLSYLANLYARLVTGIPINDVTGGFKCFHRKVLEAIDLSKINSEGYAFQIELNFLCWRKGFALAEVPIIFYDRTAGKTKMSRKVIFEAIWLVWFLRLKRLFG